MFRAREDREKLYEESNIFEAAFNDEKGKEICDGAGWICAVGAEEAEECAQAGVFGSTGSDG
jgi:hypothetical protein